MKVTLARYNEMRELAKKLKVKYDSLNVHDDVELLYTHLRMTLALLLKVQVMVMEALLDGAKVYDPTGD